MKILLKLKTGLSILAVSVISVTYMSLATASAATGSSQAACGGLNQLDSSQTCATGPNQSAITTIISNIVNAISLIAGIIIIVTVIYAGLIYITSSGDSGKVSRAKNALIYSLVGLAVIALSQALVHFAIRNI